MSDHHPASSIDHEALWEKTLKALNELSSFKISRFRVSTISGGEVFVGGFGDVRQAKLRTALFWKDPIVALKTLRPTGNREQRIRILASLARELSIWNKLKHKNILALNGFYYEATSLTTAWIATPWHKNGNVLKYVAATQADNSTRLKLTWDTAEGLAYLHNMSPPVCHGDLKPENTLINDTGDAVLCDFGLAKILEDVPSGLTTTSTNACTLRYAAPELIKGDGSSHSLASDVWAWACLFLAIMTDVLPYAGKGREAALRNAILQMESPTDISTIVIPDFIRTILSKCWNQEPTSRPEIGWCKDVLSQVEFRRLLQLPFSNVPSTFKSSGEEWAAIHNPTSDRLYAVRCVTAQLTWVDFEYSKIKFCPNPQKIAFMTGSKVAIFDITTLQERGTFQLSQSTTPQDDYVGGLCLSHGGSLIAISYGSGIIRIWTFTTQEVHRVLSGHQKQADFLCFAKADGILASASQLERAIRTWDVETGALLHVIHAEDVAGVVGSPSHPFVVVTTHEGEGAIVCDSECGRVFKLSAPATAAAFTPDGRSLITGSPGYAAEEGLWTWNLELLLEGGLLDLNGGEIPLANRLDRLALVGEPLDGPQVEISSLSLSSDGRLAASASNEHDDLVLWDLTTRRPAIKIQGDQMSEIRNLRFHSGSVYAEGTLVYTYSDGSSDVLGYIHYKLRV